MIFLLVVLLILDLVLCIPSGAISNDTVELFGSYKRIIDTTSFNSPDPGSLNVSVVEIPGWLTSKQQLTVDSKTFDLQYLVGYFTDLTKCRGVVVNNSIAYVGCYNGLAILNVTGDNATLLGFHTINGPNIHGHEVALKDNFVYVAAEKAVISFDVTDPRNPIQRQVWFAVPEVLSWKYIVAHKNADVLYIMQSGSTDDTVNVLDISNKTNMTKTAGVQNDYCDSFSISEELQVLSIVDNDSGFYFYSIANPLDPVGLSHPDPTADSAFAQVFAPNRKLHIRAEHKYLCCSGPNNIFLTIYNFPNASDFSLLKKTQFGQAPSKGLPWDILVSDDENMVIMSQQESGFKVINITDAMNPILITSIDDSRVYYGMFLEGDMLYLTTDNGLVVYNLYNYTKSGKSVEISSDSVPQNLCKEEKAKIVLRVTDSSGFIEPEYYIDLDSSKYHFDQSCTDCDAKTHFSGQRCDVCSSPFSGSNCDKCADTNYVGWYCNITTCDGMWSNSTSPDICNGRGKCTAFDSCSCDSSTYPNVDATSKFCDCKSNFYGADCSITSCGGILTNSTSPNICNGRGSCNGFDSCSCDSSTYPNVDATSKFCDCKSNYFGRNCSITSCHGVLQNMSASEICQGRGSCNGYNQCVCDTSKYPNVEGASADCSCKTHYSGSTCELTTCNGKASNLPSTCGKNGTCISYNTCECSIGKNETLVVKDKECVYHHGGDESGSRCSFVVSSVLVILMLCVWTV